MWVIKSLMTFSHVNLWNQNHPEPSFVHIFLDQFWHFHVGDIPSEVKVWHFNKRALEDQGIVWTCTLSGLFTYYALPKNMLTIHWSGGYFSTNIYNCESDQLPTCSIFILVRCWSIEISQLLYYLVQPWHHVSTWKVNIIKNLLHLFSIIFWYLQGGPLPVMNGLITPISTVI